ncbi:MAG: nucleotide exchange factor GrpE [Bacteroides sp.]
MSEVMNNQPDNIKADEAVEEAKEEKKQSCEGAAEEVQENSKADDEAKAETDEAKPEGDSQEDKEDADNQTKESAKKDPKDAIIEDLQDKYRRQMAEFDNFRKRSEKEKSAMYEIGARDIIEKILPVVDNFERGLGSISEEEKGTPFADGIDKIYKQLTKTLEDIGVKPIEAVGKEFNPDFHNAVMHVDDEEAGESIIVEEFQKGYTYRDSVVRHSMVKVAN